jgi:hypothetical protein
MMKIVGLLIALLPMATHAKTAIICSPGKDAEKYLNALLNESVVVYHAKEYDKETEKHKDVMHVLTPKKDAPLKVSAPAITEEKICVTVSD